MHYAIEPKNTWRFACHPIWNAHHLPPNPPRVDAIPMSTASTPDSPPPPAIRTPDEAIDALMQGNRRFIENAAVPYDHPAARERTTTGRTLAAVIRCRFPGRTGDRVRPDHRRAFVCGVAGNLPTPEIIASLGIRRNPRSPAGRGHGHKVGAVHAAIEHEDDVTALPGGPRSGHHPPATAVSARRGSSLHGDRDQRATAFADPG